jgi:ubiquinone/menaquinone biosynthesis C-methylase UbiE
MNSLTSTAHDFLLDFHNARPGLTPEAFASLPVIYNGQRFTSSYEVLCSIVDNTEECADILDLACGDGYLMSLLASREQRGLRLSGVDASAEELRLALARLGSRAALHQARAESLPLDSRSIDYVLCHMALMLMDRLDQVLGEIRRVLRPGGVFAAVTGTLSSVSPAFGIFTDIMRRYPKREDLCTVTFGDARIHDSRAIHDLLGATFHDVRVEELQVLCRLRPEALTRWFQCMYPPYLLSDGDRGLAAGDLRAQLELLQEADGTVPNDLTWRLISASAA